MLNKRLAESETDSIQHELERLEKALHALLPVFSKFFDPNTGGWPYTLRAAADYIRPSNYSYSTNAMIACVVGHVLGFTRERMLTVPEIKPMEAISLPEVEREKLRDTWLLAVEKLVNNLPAKKGMFKDLDPWPREWPADDALFTFSSTFGLNDPFTLTWLADLALQTQGVIDDKLAHLVDDRRPKFRERAEKLGEFLSKRFPPQPLCTTTLGDSLDHAFPWMRWARLQAAFRLELQRKLEADGPSKEITDKLQQTDERRTRLLSHLEAILHRHLSFAAIPDSEYDPPEMVLALEGVLVLQHDYDRAVVERVFTTLAQPDMSRLFWRAHRPMIAQPQGTVLPPISTEIGNALLRICGMVETSFGAALFALCQPPLRRYAEWLLSRRVNGRAVNADGLEAEFSGWHSDHVLAADTVHLWMTANTVLFLHDYTAFLRRHVRRISGFSVVSKEECRAEAEGQDCRTELAGREPLADVDSQSLYCATDRLIEDFVKPWLAREPKNFSMLLYGPPGTGKTSFAKLLAGSLGWELVQLSPSDFVRGGEAEVEDHAKAVFLALEQMSTVVVLFDEIDRLLLDRDAKAYITQGDIFQFMTPGMLTKINDLGAKKRLIFIISTNYAERIDGAIKRAGRIDQQFLWLPPDAKRRRSILAMLLAKRAKADLSHWDVHLKGDNNLKQVTDKIEANAVKKLSKELIGATTLWIFKELEKLLERAIWNPLYDDQNWNKESVLALSTGNPKQFEKVTSALLENTKRVTPAIRLLSYKNRFRSTAGEDPHRFPYADEPYEEFLLLLFDALQSGYKFTDLELTELLRPFATALKKQDLERVRDKDIYKELSASLAKWGFAA